MKRTTKKRLIWAVTVAEVIAFLIGTWYVFVIRYPEVGGGLADFAKLGRLLLFMLIGLVAAVLFATIAFLIDRFFEGHRKGKDPAGIR